MPEGAISLSFSKRDRQRQHEEVMTADSKEESYFEIADVSPL